MRAVFHDDGTFPDPEMLGTGQSQLELSQQQPLSGAWLVSCQVLWPWCGLRFLRSLMTPGHDTQIESKSGIVCFPRLVVRSVPLSVKTDANWWFRMSAFILVSLYGTLPSCNGWLSSIVVRALDLQLHGCEFNFRLRRCRVTTLGKLFTPPCLCRSQWFSDGMIDCSVRGRCQLCLLRQPLRRTALGTGCTPFLQCLGQLILSPSVGL